ncbi:MAG: glycosyltransferase family 2 protein [Chloroflexi bacterium]|nr:glycosyltransferase family 2 protein [Chloroflexota bacterium]
MPEITFAVITKNEETQIAECLKGAAWSDEILVLDSFSSDRTVEIARLYTDRVFRREFTSFPHQRNNALSLATGDWVLFVDADERVTPELAGEVRAVVRDQADRGSTHGFWIPRKDIIWGKWIRHGGWYPDYQLRLLERNKARYDESRQVHELVQLEGQAGYLRNPFVHYNYHSVGQFLAKQRVYTTFEATILHDRGIRPRPHNFILQPLRAFKRRYLDLQGYRDGGHGFLLATLLAYYEFVTYRKLQAMRRNDRPRFSSGSSATDRAPRSR